MKRLLITLVLLTGIIFTAEAQKGTGGGQGGQRQNSNTTDPQKAAGQSEERQRLDTTPMVERIMNRFDANGDGILSQSELTQAMTDMQKNRSQKPAQNDQPSGTNQAVKAEQRPEPPPADKIAAQMIEKFSASKTGLTQDELSKALEDRHSQQGNRGERPARGTQPAK